MTRGVYKCGRAIKVTWLNAKSSTLEYLAIG